MGTKINERQKVIEVKAFKVEGCKTLFTNKEIAEKEALRVKAREEYETVQFWGDYSPCEYSDMVKWLLDNKETVKLMMEAESNDDE